MAVTCGDSRRAVSGPVSKPAWLCGLASCTLPRVHRQAVALAAAAVGATVLVLTPLHAADARSDYAAAAWTILPPGANGSLTFDRNTTDQARMHDALTPLGANVTPAHLRRLFKPARLGPGAEPAVRRERPRARVTVLRDRFGVAHVTGRTEDDVAFGAG